jgi:hypothetical protein
MSESTDVPSHADEHSEQPLELPRRKPNRRTLAIAVASAVVLGAVAAIVVVSAQPTALERAQESCSGSKPLDSLLDDVRRSASPEPEVQPTDDGNDEIDKLFEGVVSIEDDGKTLIIQTKPKDDDPLGITGLALDCVYTQLDVPAHVSERIGATRSLDGRQEDTWNGYSASWSYHPDNGANVIIVAK